MRKLSLLLSVFTLILWTSCAVDRTLLPTDEERLASLVEQGADLAAMADVASYDPKITYDDCNPINPVENIVSTTFVETNLDADDDGDGIPDYLDGDSDNDGISDAVEGTGDSDEDGIPNYLDNDDDADGVETVDENTNDDGDGLPDVVDTDTDNDAILDSEEGNESSDGDGTPPGTYNEDTNGNGDPTNSDTDGDSIPDYLDTDDDGDGIDTIDEDINQDGDPSNDDTEETPDIVDEQIDELDDEPSIGEGGINETPTWATAGTLTVSESKDLEDWNYWNSIESEHQRYQDDWGLYPKHRVSVELTDVNNKVCIDKTLYLINESNELVWTARTDNKGTAELWINYTSGVHEDVWLIVVNDDQTESIYPVQTFENGVNQIQLDGIAQEKNNCDILIAFDSTGSMGDELQYIKAEVRDVLTKLEDNHSDVHFRYSSVFYRDHDHTTYVTNSMTFSPSKEDTRSFINQQNVKAGVDAPEAVHTAMQMSIVEQNWSKSARARIMFLILDAPPHDNSCVIERIQVLTKEAARKGIKLIPITASDSNKETEFLMRFAALFTNGTYGYITDDSGIGNDHQEASVGAPAAVEYLNDMMLRVVSENLE